MKKVTNQFYTFLLTSCLLFAGGQMAQAAIKYVKPVASGTGDGSSWANASNNLQAMINAANSGDEIWVAAGTYKPTSGTDRNISFVMKNGVAILGGFPASGNPGLGDRDVAANGTTLSGDIGTLGDNSDNSYHVILNDQNGLDGSAVLNGFTITGGNANIGSSLLNGQGGGMYNSGASPSVVNCSFVGNYGVFGGGMYGNGASSPTVTNCSFSGNSSFAGGGMYNVTGSPVITNCSFSGNSGTSEGGGVFNFSTASVTITNCILWGNSTEIENLSPQGPITVTNSIVEGGHPGTGNLDVDPLFISQPSIGLGISGDLHISPCSAAKDVGTAVGAPATDFDGDARPFGAGVDMGFDENGADCCSGGNIIYVNQAATGANDGSSWSDAFTELRVALNAPCSNATEIWVAAGTYKPTSTTDRNTSFVMKNNLAIYGGFVGGENSLGARDWVNNVTILSGDIGTPGDNGDNSYHVIFNDQNGLNGSAVLDGFTITGGYAVSLIFPESSGGGMLNRGSSPTVTNCIFSGNRGGSGGGMSNHSSSSPTVTNCTFSGNRSESGGGMRNSISSSPSITNCIFFGNATGAGGGIANALSSSPTITNCSFSGNSAGDGGGMFNLQSTPTVKNCILWGNSSEISGTANITFSIVQGGHPGTGNLDKDPLFVTQPSIFLGATGDLHLQEGSAAINTGTTGTNVPAIDFDGDARPNGCGIDMGFDENISSSTNILYVNQAATGANTGTSWEHAYTDLQDALNSSCPFVTEIWVAAGTYKPTSGTDRTVSFVMKNNLAIYGGFAGGETSISQRNWNSNVTTLSGDIGTPGNMADNSYHIIYNNSNGLGNFAILDGFHLKYGNSNQPSFPYNGGGAIRNIGASPSIRNCTFSENYGTFGGAVSCSNSSPNISNCTFTNNTAGNGGGGGVHLASNSSARLSDCTFSGNNSTFGGGAYIGFSAPFLNRCKFSGNSASNGGGLMITNLSSPTLTNCAIFGNTASNNGGGIYNNDNSTPELMNCSLSGNSAPNGGAISSTNSNPQITNSILWGNSSEIIGTSSVTYSIVEGGQAGTGNLDADPNFVLQPPVGLGTTGDLHIETCSPAKDAGTSAGAPTFDIDGHSRPFGSSVDMGFDESITICCPQGNFLFVDQNATGANTGHTWADAFTDLQDALNAPCPNVTQIWVAAGTYKPTSGTDRSVSFVMKNGVAIYGGFAGGETMLSQRDWTANVTTLSGDIGTPSNSSDNSFNVVSNINNSLNASAILDGFTITQGNATGSGFDEYGAGMINENASPAIANCIFDTNSTGPSGLGGGMYNNNSSPIVTNCSFFSNSANQGGGMYNKSLTGSSPIVTNCYFAGNSAADEGGAMFNQLTVSSKVINCAFIGNTADNDGGGIYNKTAIFLEVVNCSFSGNSAGSQGGGMYNFDSGTSTLTNCILWGNSSGLAAIGNSPTVTYSIVQGGFPGTGNLNVNPLFVSQPSVGLGIGGDLNLQVTSPAIDAGNDAANSTSTDLAGNNRKFDVIPGGALIDMGAYENQTAACQLNPVCASPTVQLDGSGNVTVDAVDLDNGSTGCGTLSFSIGGMASTSFDCMDIGANTVTLTVTDDNGSATCSATVTVEDVTPPNALCKDITKNVGSGPEGNVTLLPSEVNNLSTDNCGGTAGVTLVSVSPNSFNCASVSALQTVTLTVKDAQNLTSICTASVTFIDQTAPTAICKTATIQLDGSGNATLMPAQVDDNSTDNCGITSMSVLPNNFTCANVGFNSVTLTVEDASGGNDNCQTQVEVIDATDPTAVCQDITVGLDMSGNASITGSQLDGGSSDNCGIASFSASPNTFTTANIGPNTVTLTVIDDNGRQTTCPATVTVSNANPPNAQCKDATVQLDINGNATVTTTLIDDGSSAIGGIASMSVSPSTLTCADIPQETVTLTVTANNGLTDACTATVTVQDISSPSANCKTATIQLDGSGNATLMPAQVDDNSTDNCGIASIAVSPNSFTCQEVGNQMVTLSVVDVNGNPASTCVTAVTIEDNVPPAMVCQDVVVQLDASGNVGVTPAQVDNGSMDACGIASLSVSPNSFTLANEGVNPVTLTATDVNGNPNTCMANVTVENNQLPNAVCQNISRSLDINGEVNLAGADIDGGSSVLGGIASMSVSPNFLDCGNIGTNTVTLTVLGNNGQSASCNATVTVSDDTAPTALCKNAVVELDASGQASLAASEIDNGSTDNCGVASISVSPNSFDCTDVGQKSVMLTVTDVNGLSSNCTASVTVSDNVPPAMLCQDVVVQLDASGNAGVIPAQVDNGSMDACGIASLSVSPNSFTLANEGVNPVTLTATDTNGNPNTCMANVTVENNQLPNAVCQNISRSLDNNGEVNLAGADIDGGSSVLGGIASMSVSPNFLGCGNIGANTVTLTVLGNNGQSASCNATVMVSDDTAPTALCKNAVVELDASGQASLAASEIDNGSTDNCGVASTDVSPNQFTCSEVGANQVTLTMTDVNGLSSTCLATVTVEDSGAPSAVCQAATVFLDADGQVNLTASQIDGGSSDVCGISSVSVSPNAFTCTELGANIVTLTVTDVNGQTSSCNTTVTVEDNILPYANCKDLTVQLDADGNASISAADVDNGSGDNCSFSLSASPLFFDCTNVGPNPVTLTVTDESGNPAACVSNVTVEDITPPTANCQDVTVYLDANGEAVLAASQVDNNSSDACGIMTVSVSPNAFTCGELGANPVTLTVTDVNGNPASCSATVSVVDDAPPTVLCQDISIQLDASGNADIVPADVFANGNDNCGNVNLVSVSPNQFDCGEIGENTVTLTAEDGSGNISICTATVTVEDFFASFSTSSTPEVCGYGNGSITVTANAPGGQIAYSIDGGASWQFSGEFFQLSSGTYEVMVQAFGTSGCTTPSTLVEVGQTGSPIVWYKDMDGDGWSDGITLTQCLQPAGFYQASELISINGDCNDHDANMLPGQIWYEDLDGDGHGSGLWEEACLRPYGCFLASELSQISGDCDDLDAAIHPGAVEVCNGIDDDCDGEVDEGTTGGLAFVGNVILANQAQVDAFSHCYSIIDGNLTIKNSGVVDLSNLVNLEEVTGDVYIKSTGLSNMGGLENLTTIGGYLKVQFNNSLTTLDGLENVALVGGYLRVYSNNNLTDCCAIHPLLDTPGAIGGSVVIFRNDTGCDSPVEVENYCTGGSNLMANSECNDCGIFEVDVDGLQFDLFPNPASTIINVSLQQAPKEKGEVTLFNMLGQAIELKDLEIGQTELSFDMSFRQGGEYIVRVNTEHGSQMKRVIVVR